MNKQFAFSTLSYCVFYIFSALCGLHLAYIASFFLSRVFSTHLQTIGVFYLNNSYSFTVSQTEFIHMQEVGQLLLFAHVLTILFLPLVVFLVWYYKKRKLFLKTAFWIFPLLVFIISIMAIALFDTAFTLFHMIFFRNEYWQFPADSIILQAYPLQFFIELFGILLLGFFVVLFIIYRFLKKK